MEATKDYYRILNVRSSASAAEIKNAYRKLAVKYHPDKNPNDALAAAVFTDVAEAYGVLNNEETRKKYNSNRYITAPQEYKKPIEAIETLLLRIDKINKHIQYSNPFHFNKDAVLYSLKQLFPEDVTLLLYTNEKLLQQFLRKIVIAAQSLDSYQTKQLIVLLQPLYTKQQWLQQSLNNTMQQQQKQERWEKYKIILAVAAAIILCIIIFLAAGK